MKNMSKIKWLYLDGNELNDVGQVLAFGEFEQLRLSLYTFEANWEILRDRLNNTREAEKLNQQFTFLIAFFLTVRRNETEGELFVDCQMTLFFIRKNVLFNLFYPNQVDKFLNECLHLEFDF